MYLNWAPPGGQMQSTAGQSFPGRVHQQKMKRRIILRITLAAAWLTRRLAQNPPSENQSKRPIRRGTWDFAGLAAPSLDP